MKKFHQNNQNKILDTPKQHKIKGGIRYFTNNYVDFQKKQRELSQQGIYYDTHEDDGVFCVEW